MAIRTDSLVPDGDMMGHEQLPPVPTPLEAPFSNILKRDLGKNFKDTVNNFTYVALLDDVKGDPVQVLREHPPPTKSGTTNTHPTPVTVQHHIFKEEISSNLQVQEDVPGGKKTVPMEDSDVQEGDQVQVLREQPPQAWNCKYRHGCLFPI